MDERTVRAHRGAPLLILASASPRRRQLLRKAGLAFRVIPSHVSEISREKNPIRLVRQLALRKAQQVARNLPLTLCPLPQGERENLQKFLLPLREKVAGGRMRGKRVLVLGADTVVVLRGRILGKPRDVQDAYRMLYRLSGSTHQVYTGVALIDARTHKTLVTHAKSDVRMKKIPIDRLMALSRMHLDKAGSYAIQEKRDPIARVIKGSYDNVVGLPIGVVKGLLKKLSRDA